MKLYLVNDLIHKHCFFVFPKHLCSQKAKDTPNTFYSFLMLRGIKPSPETKPDQTSPHITCLFKLSLQMSWCLFFVRDRGTNAAFEDPVFHQQLPSVAQTHTGIVSQNAGFEIGLHARPSSDPSSLNHPNYKAATLQDSWPYSYIKNKNTKKGGGNFFRRASKLFQAPWWLWGKKFSTNGAGGLCSSAEDHMRSRTTLFAFSFFISAGL